MHAWVSQSVSHAHGSWVEFEWSVRAYDISIERTGWYLTRCTHMDCSATQEHAPDSTTGAYRASSSRVVEKLMYVSFVPDKRVASEKHSPSADRSLLVNAITSPCKLRRCVSL